MSSRGWTVNLFRPLVIGVMVGCIAVSLVDLVHLLFPTWNGMFLIAGCVLAAVEANYSRLLIRARALRGVDVLKFRAIEMAMFFVALKIGSYAGDPLANVVADIKLWPLHPSRIFDLETIAAFVMAFMAWMVSTETIADLERIGEPPDQRPSYVSPIESLTDRFFWGGGMLLALAGLTRIGIASLLHRLVGELESVPSVSGMVLNVLVYFLLGLVILGQVHLVTLSHKWQSQKVKVAGELAGRWVRYSVVSIGLAALAAFLLPTGYTLGLLQTGSFLVSVLLAVISFVGFVLFSICLIPLSWIAWLIAKLLGAGAPAPPAIPQMPELPQQAGGAAPSWYDLLQSLFFWVAALGIVYFVIKSYLGDHPELVQALVALRPVQAARRLWINLRQLLSRWGRAINRRLVLGGRLPRVGGLPLAEPAQFFRLGALPPRERILYYYLSILRRAGQQGFPRRHAQTPYEYDNALGSQLPQAQQDMGTLTQAFVEARYSQHTVEPDAAKRVRTHWQRVKDALRALRRKA